MATACPVFLLQLPHSDTHTLELLRGAAASPALTQQLHSLSSDALLLIPASGFLSPFHTPALTLNTVPRRVACVNTSVAINFDLTFNLLAP